MAIWKIILLICIVSSSCSAQIESHLKKHEFAIDAAILAVAWSADTITTDHAWERCKTCYETGGLFNGSRDVPKIMVAWAGVDVASAVVAYEWKERVHNKYLQPLWRVPMAVRIQAHTQAAFHNRGVQ